MGAPTSPALDGQVTLPNWVADPARERDLSDLGITGATVTTTLGAPQRLTVGLAPDQFDVLVKAAAGYGPDDSDGTYDDGWGDGWSDAIEAIESLAKKD